MDVREERGAISAEYMGMVALAAAVVFALVSLPLGDRIAREVELLICKIANGGECPAEIAIDPECLVSSDTRASSFTVTVAVVTVGGGATLIKEVFADGRIRYTLVDDALVAAELIAGARARVGRLGFNAAASASAGGRLEGARVFEFPPDQADAASDFEERVENEGTVSDLFHQAAEGDGFLGTVLGGPLAGFDPLGIKDGVADFIFGEDADDLPEPTSTFVDAELFVQGDADLGAGIPGLDGALEAAAEGAGGAKVFTSGPDAGDVELHFNLEAEVAADLGILALGPGIGGDTTVTATLLLDNTGDSTFRPQKLTVTGTAGYSGSPLNATQILNEADLASLSTALESASAGSSSGTGQQVEFSAELDLSDPQNLEATLGVLAGGAAGVPALVQRFDRDGRLTFQVYDTAATDSGVEVAVGAGVGGGGGVETSTDAQDLADAYVREPGGTWGPRNCGRRD
jgi:hypothetical protein